MTRSTLAVLLLFCCTVVSGQPDLKFSFTHYSSANGLLSSQVNSIAQDSDGYIWIASAGGLQRFDGARFKDFRHNRKDSFSIPANNIIQIKRDKKNNLWILGGDGRAGIFDTHTFRFQEAGIKVKDPNSLRTEQRRLITDTAGNVFFLYVGHEIVTYDPGRNLFSFENNFFRLPDQLRPSDMVQDPVSGKYYIGIAQGGVAVFDRSSGKMSYKGNNEAAEWIVDAMADIPFPTNFFLDSRQRLWFDNWGPGYPYIYSFDLKNNKPLLNKHNFVNKLQSYYECYGYYEQTDGSIWIRGEKVFARFNELNSDFDFVHNGYTNERSIAYEAINNLYEDRENNIWVGSKTGGVYRFNPDKQYFSSVTHMHRRNGQMGSGAVMTAISTRWNTILVGAWGDGVYHYDNDFNLIPTDIKGIDNKGGPSIWNMIQSADSNTIWASAQPGIYAIDQQNRKATYYNPPILRNITIRQILEDRKGNIWLGMQHYGLFKWDAGKVAVRDQKAIRRVDAIPVVQVNKIINDSKGRIWVATSKEGLYVLDQSTDSVLMIFGRNKEESRRLPEDAISSVLQYNDSTFLISTSAYVVMFNENTGRITILSDPENIVEYIASLEKDNKGYVWVSTTNGLYRLNPLSGLIVSFKRTDGIDNENFITGSSRLLPDGRMLFGSTSQFIYFNPDIVNIGNALPRITITDFRVMNKSLLVDSLKGLKNVSLDYKDNSLIIEFSSLTYGTAYIDMMYKLDGLDKDWKYADKTYQAVYSYLPPGDYKFMIRSIDADGTASNHITTLAITINPPFWKTWWFYSLLALFVGVLLFWTDRERMKRKEAIQQMRTEIADNLHQEVTATLNNITILSEIAKMKADKDLEKSKEYIDQINEKSRKMMYNMEDMLWSINPNNDSMDKMLLRMKEFADGYEKEFGLAIDLQVDKKLNSVKLDMKQRQELFFIFKDAVNCMVHNFKADKGDINLDLEQQKLLLKIRAEKINGEITQDFTCPYIRDIRKRADQLKAPIDFEMDKKIVSLILQVAVNN